MRLSVRYIPKTVWLFSLVVVIWFCLPLLGLRGPDRFAPDRLVVDYRGEFPIEEANEITARIFASLKKDNRVFFNYLGHGTQMVAFGSEDGQYVLKCFLQTEIDGPKRGGMRPLLRLMPSYRKTEREKAKVKRAKKLTQALSAYATSFELLKKETGVISLHIHPTEHLFPKCFVRDRYGIVHEIDLDRTAFLLQRRVELLADRFAKIKTKEQYHQSVAAMQQLFKDLSYKGVSDFNNRFKPANYGFIDDQAFMIDTGRTSYSQGTKENPDSEIHRMEQFFFSWLKKSY